MRDCISMATQAEQTIVETLRTKGRALKVAEIRNELRKRGMPLSEEVIRATCEQSQSIRNAGAGLYGLLSQILVEEELADAPVPGEPDEICTIGNMVHLLEGNYCVFDIETTGIDADADKIIEIAAVRVRSGLIADCFFSPVNAEGRELTSALRKAINLEAGSVRDLLIKNATSFAEVFPQFMSFVGKDLLVAHNGTGLDFPFLVKRGLSAGHPVLDSLQLAYLIKPTLAKYDLESLSKLFEVQNSPEIGQMLSRFPSLKGAAYHNALFDSILLALVVRNFVQEARSLSSPSAFNDLVLAVVPEFFGKRYPPLGTNSDICERALSTLGPSNFPERNVQRAEVSMELTPTSVIESFSKFVSSTGRQPRQGQTEMVRLVSTALIRGGIKLIEAPTGTGKSIGLAFPAAEVGARSQAKFVIATKTKNLQDQLEADIEKLKSAGLDFTSAKLKGRSNYLCLSALASLAEDILQSESPLASRYCLAFLLRWAFEQCRQGLAGDIDDIPYGLKSKFSSMSMLISSVRAERTRCRLDKCRQHAGCFREQALAQAEHASVLLTNHALWLSPIMDDFNVQGVLLDEAHELEDSATSVCTEEVTKGSLSSLLSQILSNNGKLGILPRLVSRSMANPALLRRVRECFGLVRQVRAEAVRFGRELCSFLKKLGLDPESKYGARLRMRSSLSREFPARWREVSGSQKLLDTAMRALIDAVKRTAGEAESDPLCSAFQGELDFLVEQLQQTCKILETVLSNKDARFVCWMEARANVEQRQSETFYDWSLHRAPIDVGTFIRQKLSAIPSAVLTSASLTIRGKDFSFILNRLGLNELLSVSDLHVLPGAFDYDENALFIIPRYLDKVPDRSSGEFFVQELSRELGQLFRFTEGRGLCLFTARSRLQHVYQKLDKALSPLNITVHAQSEGGSSEALRKAFASDEHSVLLGLRSFWQGVDVPGPSLSVVVMEKLPFPLLGDPVTDGRREHVAARGGHEFEDFLLPLTLLGFKQGFGRLIRSDTDRGAVFLMDRRIHYRSYKQDLLATLPGSKRIPECEASRRECYRMISEHLPALFVGRNVAELLEQLPAELLSEIGQLVAMWKLPNKLSEEEYERLRPKILQFLERVFGFSGFRLPEQEQIAKAVLTGCDVVGLMPTGAGKSLAFQLPALLRDGLTVVVSPLIALMKDQVDRLKGKGLEMVDAITSAMTTSEKEEVLRRALSGKLRLLYVSPERLRDGRLLASLAETKIAGLVVDEAHCISMWGPTFRPEYSDIADFCNRLPDRPNICAVTATATPQIEEDIKKRLNIQSARRVQADFDRPEIHYVVFNKGHWTFPINSANDKFTQTVMLARTAAREQAPMISYTSTVKMCEELSGKLNALGFAARPYHGQLEPDEREETQDLFLDDQLQIIVATKAFGMGIDKPDIRYVVHYDVPGDLESFIQESGRAGRDGQKSYSILLYHARDVRTQQWFIDNGSLTADKLQELADAIRADVEGNLPISIVELSQQLGYEDHIVQIAIQRLQESGWLRRQSDITAEASVTLLELQSTCKSILSGNSQQVFDKFLQFCQLETMSRTQINLIEIGNCIGISPDALDTMFLELATKDACLYRPFSRAVVFEKGPLFNQRISDIKDPYQAARQKKLQDMTAFATDNRSCRRRTILNYLGQNAAERCSACDVCCPNIDMPWSRERPADVPNPAELFNEKQIVLDLVQANGFKAQEEGRSPLSAKTLKAILRGNVYAILKHERDPYLKKWREKRYRSFKQWGLFASMENADETIARLFESLLSNGFIEIKTSLVEAGFAYEYFGLTGAGLSAILGEMPLDGVPNA